MFTFFSTKNPITVAATAKNVMTFETFLQLISLCYLTYLTCKLFFVGFVCYFETGKQELEKFWLNCAEKNETFTRKNELDAFYNGLNYKVVVNKARYELIEFIFRPPTKVIQEVEENKPTTFIKMELNRQT